MNSESASYNDTFLHYGLKKDGLIKPKRLSMLSTIDNPFNPFDDFDNWYQFDTEKHYNSCQLLARFAFTSSELSVEENDLEIERAIDEIIKHDVTGKRIRIYESNKNNK